MSKVILMNELSQRPKITVYVQPEPISDRIAFAACCIGTASIMGGTLTALFLVPGFAPFLGGALLGLAINKS